MKKEFDLEALKKWSWKASPYFIFFLFLVVFHSVMHIRQGDCISFMTIVIDKYEGDCWDAVIFRWFSWSGRILIEYVEFVVCSFDDIVFKALDIAIWLFLMFMLSVLFNYKKSILIDYVIMGGLVIYDFKDMASAGYLSCMIVYVWPFVAFLVACLPLKKKLFDGEATVPLWLMFVSVVCMIFAANNEQLCALGVGIISVFLGYVWVKEMKIDWLACVLLAVCLVEMYAHLVCPGNATRTEAESNIFPNMVELPLLLKFSQVITSELTRMPSSDAWCVIYWLMCITLPYLLWKKGDMKSLAVSFLPLIVLLAITCFGDIRTLFNSKNIYDVISTDGSGVYLSCLITIIYVASLSWTLFAVSPSEHPFELRMILPLLFLAGFFTKIITAYSPMGIMENTRTFFIQEMAMVAILSVMWRWCVYDSVDNKTQWGVVVAMVICGVWYYKSSLIPFTDALHI